MAKATPPGPDGTAVQRAAGADGPPGDPGPAARRHERMVRRSLTAAIVLCAVTSLACLAAVGAEAWRFGLMLRGRTEVLPAGPVDASALAVAATGLTAMILAIAALLATAVAAERLTSAAAARVGAAPPRSRRGLMARMLVPGWNWYGVGQVLAETIRTVLAAAHEHPAGHAGASGKLRRLGFVTWCAWIANGILVAVVLGLTALRLSSARWLASEQLAANLVEAHIALDALAAITAALAAATLVSLRSEWSEGRTVTLRDWVVAPPESTARNRQPMREVTPVRTGVDSSASTTSAT